MQSTSSRRTFVKSLAASGIVAGLGIWRQPVWAVARPGQSSEQGVLAGTQFDLTIDSLGVNFSGRERTAMAINGSIPGPLLRWREGDTVTLRVHNRLPQDTSIHWHGILLPANMDGVPGFSFAGIAPDGMYEYRFKVKQSGTYWYHSHSAFQEQLGVYGPLVIDPLQPEPFQYERDYVVMLTDWTDESPARVLDKLKKQSDYYNRGRRTVGDFINDVAEQGWRETLGNRWAWAKMKMTPTDLADISGETYTYLLNGQAPDGNWTGLFEAGERIRLRLINGSAMTYFDFRIPGLKLTVVAVDGQTVEPVEVDELRLAVAETVDVLVTPDGSQSAYTLFAQSMDRSGFARGTLAVRDGLSAPVPELDPRPELSMEDMGHGDMAGMDHSAMGHTGMADAGGQVEMQAHPASENDNPLVDMQTMMPVPKLNDPGIGLRDNGRRVLTYADLRSTFPDPDGREPMHTIELHLTGHMERFAWSFDGIPFADAEPVRLKYGERVRFVLVNDTMMHHPIHLHGMWSDLEDEHGNFQVRKHTIDMPPGSKRSYRVTADALGRWAYHCHMLMHMDLGMFREVRVEESEKHVHTPQAGAEKGHQHDH
ncbi:copper resistance system multicopper oxidase [Pseudomonas stutzeri]|uniref:copper resistance system multicopper oxidase n=1 Tax=Stutzerimonas stutzeri TaxID=316 RepID=UPI00210CB4D6|nr:copper resistance system multicopper oxidase [Stutzerimonas stutzeri]MCQ4312009.1 copper resistance system multicopper oxidase [Stutzerimonas stutzeri]